MVQSADEHLMIVFFKSMVLQKHGPPEAEAATVTSAALRVYMYTCSTKEFWKSTSLIKLFNIMDCVY